MVSRGENCRKMTCPGEGAGHFGQIAGLCRSDNHSLDLAVITEFLDGGNGADVVAVVDGIVVSLGVADDLGIGDLELSEQELIPEEHINALGAKGMDQGTACILGTIVHKDRSLGEDLAQGHRVPVDHSVHILSDQSHGFRLLSKPFRN